MHHENNHANPQGGMDGACEWWNIAKSHSLPATCALAMLMNHGFCEGNSLVDNAAPHNHILTWHFHDAGHRRDWRHHGGAAHFAAALLRRTAPTPRTHPHPAMASTRQDAFIPRLSGPVCGASPARLDKLIE